ncbi:hypothetical protein WMF28_30235 [Sorangium sp. So ce590]
MRPASNADKVGAAPPGGPLSPARRASSVMKSGLRWASAAIRAAAPPDAPAPASSAPASATASAGGSSPTSISCTRTSAARPSRSAASSARRTGLVAASSTRYEAMISRWSLPASCRNESPSAISRKAARRRASSGPSSPRTCVITSVPETSSRVKDQRASSLCSS